MKGISVKRAMLPAALAGSLSVVLLLSSVATAAGEKVAVYGGDLTPSQRQELETLFGVDATVKTDTVSSQELIAAQKQAGLEASASDKAISSSLLTCGNKGDGLTVKTQNITRIPAATYANALVTAGVGDADVLIAAPPSNPVSGESALIGALKAFPQCQGGKQPEQARVNLAYEQVARTADLAGESGDLNKASTVLLKAGQPVVTGQAKDDASIGSALDQAATSEGIQVPAAQKPGLVAFLKKLGGVDYGTYAKGYQIQQLSPTEAKVLPAGAGAPVAAASTAGAPTAVPASAAAAAAVSAAAPTAAAQVAIPTAGPAFTGDVQKAGDPLSVRTNTGDRVVTAGQNLVVSRDGKAASLSDIQAGDKVNVTPYPDGTAQTIDATSTGGFNPLWLLPLLLLLLAALWLLFGRKRRDSFILQRRGASAVVANTAPIRTDENSRRRP